MAGSIVEIPFREDITIYNDVDWTQLVYIFYQDDAETTPVDFSSSTFSGEILDKPGGTKIYDITFNTPANDGRIEPSITETQAAALTQKTVHFFVDVTTGTNIEPYFHGTARISKNHKAGE